MAIFFSLRGLPLLGRLSTVPVSCNFFNSLLTPRFVFSQEIRLSTSSLCTPSNKTSYKNLVLVAEHNVDC